MRKTVSLALSHGVQIGAHPAYQDLVGFGRRSMACTAQEAAGHSALPDRRARRHLPCSGRASQLRQTAWRDVQRHDGQPGAIAGSAQAVAAYDRSLPLMLMATRDNSASAVIGDEYGVTLWFEAFADRAYDSAGKLLVSRSLKGAVHHDPEKSSSRR
jgi:UPF0271 protein